QGFFFGVGFGVAFGAVGFAVGAGEGEPAGCALSGATIGFTSPAASEQVSLSRSYPTRPWLRSGAGDSHEPCRSIAIGNPVARSSSTVPASAPSELPPSLPPPGSPVSS